MDACERIREHLSGCGLLSYAPGIAKGPCRAPYVVVRGAGSYAHGVSASMSIGRRMVTLYCFVPREGGNLAQLVARVKQAMKGLGTLARSTGNEGPEMLEQEYDARSQSVEYQVLRAE